MVNRERTTTSDRSRLDDTAQVLYFTAPGSLELRREPLDRSADGDRVLVRSQLIGISAGTELLFWRGTFPRGLEGMLPSGSGGLEYPIAFGYSNVGYVDNVDNNGERPLVFAFEPHRTTWLAAPSSLIALPPGATAEDGIFLPNLETAVGIVQTLRPVLGETILVAGLGVVGLLVAELLARSHAGTLLLVDPNPFRRRVALENIQSDSCRILAVDAGEELREIVHRECEGRGVDRAVNVSGNAEALAEAIELMAVEGVIVEASWYGATPVTLPLGGAFHRKRLTIRSFQVSEIGGELSPRWSKARRLALVLDHLDRIRPSRYLTHRIALDRAEEAFRLLDHGAEVLQVALVP